MAGFVPRIGRCFLILGCVTFLACLGYYVRVWMGAALVVHSFWHYVVRYFAIMGAIFAVILLTKLLSERGPSEVLDDVLPEEPPFKFSNLFKRAVDILIAIVLLSLMFPVLGIITLLIYILEGSPIFYVSKRYIALDYCVSVLKFRTMVRNATAPKYRLKDRYMREGYLDIPLDCEVYTPIGRFLERTQLVEILQLFNVLLHGMSLIGNRPLPKDNITLLRQFDGWQGRFASPAGLSGMSQVVGKLNQSPQERLELERLYSDLYRNKHVNILRCDLLIVYHTLRLLFLQKTLPFDHAKQILVSAAGK